MFVSPWQTALCLLLTADSVFPDVFCPHGRQLCAFYLRPTVFFQMFVSPWQTALCLLLTAMFFEMFVNPWQTGLLYLLLTADNVFPDVCGPMADSFVPFTYSGQCFPDVCVPMADRLVIPFTYSRQCFSSCLCTHGRQACCTFYLQPTEFFQVFVYPWQTGLLYLLLTADGVFPGVCVPMADSRGVPFTYS